MAMASIAICQFTRPICSMYGILTIIYLHLGDFSRANVGKYSSTMAGTPRPIVASPKSRSSSAAPMGRPQAPAGRVCNGFALQIPTRWCPPPVMERWFINHKYRYIYHKPESLELLAPIQQSMGQPPCIGNLRVCELENG